MTDPLATSPTIDEPISLAGLRAISESSQPSLLQEQSTSPVAIEGGPAYFDSQAAQQKQDSRQNSLDTSIAGGPSEVYGSNLQTKANRIQRGDQKFKASVPPSANRTKHADNNNIPGQPPQRRSTANTTNTQNSESFADSAVWDQKAILALDGGGIRGYSALLIIQKLMEAIGRLETTRPPGPHEADGPADSSYYPKQLPEKRPAEDPLPRDHGITEVFKTKFSSKRAATGAVPGNHVVAEKIKTASSPWLPCHYFDYMAGTSTGGLIAIMLGRLRMNIDDCIAEYETLGAKVFGRCRWFHLRSPLFWPRDKYNHKVLKKVVRDVVRRYVPKVPDFPGGRNFAFDENRCRVMVIAFQKQRLTGVEKPYLFRTYENLHRSDDPNLQKWDRNPALAHDVPIWQVARATAAAPTYLKPVIIDGLEYLDGGFGANNPCEEIYDEVKKMNNNAKRCAKIILSVGTGKNNEVRRFKGDGIYRYVNYLNFAAKWATDSERTHEKMAKARDNLEDMDRFHYYRLNVEVGLGRMKLDEWRARHPIRKKIGVYIGKLRSRKAGNGFRNVTPSATPFEKIDKHTSNQPQARNGNAISTERAPENDANPHEQAQNGLEAQVPFHHDASSVAGDNEKGLNSHIDDGAKSVSGVIPECVQSRNKTIEKIREHTGVYLNQEHVKEWIEECAKTLVDGRRDRVKSNPQRWERACFGAWYQCKIRGCPRGEKKYPQRKDMRKHLLDKHPEACGRPADDNDELENMLDTCKTVVR